MAEAKAKSANEIRAAFEFLPMVQDFLDHCMSEGGASSKSAGRLEQKNSVKVEEALKFIGALPHIDKSIHELREKRDILKMELLRKKTVK